MQNNISQFIIKKFAEHQQEMQCDPSGIDNQSMDSIAKSLFFRLPSMQLTKEGHKFVKKHYDYTKIDLKVKAITNLQQLTLNRLLKYPWYLEKVRRPYNPSQRAQLGEKTYTIFTIYMYGNEESIMLKMLDGDLEKWTRNMNDSKLYKMLFEK